MHNHIHVLWCKQDAWIDKNVQQQFSKFTAQQLKFSLLDKYTHLLSQYESTQRDRIFQFWERRPYKATMYSRLILEQKLDYIHQNPVKAGLCSLPEEYCFSSAKYYMHNVDEEHITNYMEHI